MKPHLSCSVTFSKILCLLTDTATFERMHMQPHIMGDAGNSKLRVRVSKETSASLIITFQVEETKKVCKSLVMQGVLRDSEDGCSSVTWTFKCYSYYEKLSKVQRELPRIQYRPFIQQ